MSLRKTESGLKMNEKVYTGEKYSFRCRKEIGRGGNGKVYRIAFCGRNPGYKAVAKFLTKCNGNRYKRFNREIKTVMENVDNDGILPILDYHCPEKLTKDNQAWYMMPLADKFCVTEARELKDCLLLMHQLAKTIEKIHLKEIAHRDIKPDNLLFYEGRLVLSDFGMVRTLGEERITVTREHLGPYRIRPKELEWFDEEFNLDYRPSDVYLFAKVLWMTLRRDWNGFRGQYNRKDAQIYLDREQLQYDVLTLEPIHQLMELATAEEMNDRISISESIGLIEHQISILEGSCSEVDHLCYLERIRKVTADTDPEEVTTTDKLAIYKAIDQVFPYATITIQSNGGKAHKTSLMSSKHMISGDMIILLTERNNVPVQIKMSIVKMIINKKSNDMRLTITNIEDRDSTAVTWSEFCVDPIGVYRVVILGENEEVIIRGL